MLYVLFSEAEHINGVYNGMRSDFDDLLDLSWFDDPLVKRIVREVDKSEHIKDYIIKSPVFGYIPPRMLSMSAKTLILMYKANYVTDLVYVGDNCAELLVEISKRTNIFCSSDNPYICFEGIDGFEAICLNDGALMKTDEEWTYKFYEHVDKPIEEHATDIMRYINERTCNC